MSYNAISFTPFDTLPASDLNILAANDASFNDGTGIANLEIGSGHTSVKIDYKFSVYRNAGFNVVGGTAKLAYDAKEFDTGTNFDAVTNNRFVAPVTGFYFFTACVNFQSSTSDAYFVTLYKNNAETKRGYQYANSITETVGMQVSALLSLTASDYIEIFTFNGSGTNKTGAPGSALTYFSGFLLSQT